MKKLLFLFCFVLLKVSYSQELLPVNYDTTVTNSQVLIHGNAFHLSSAIENGLTRKFLFGGEITEDIKQKSFDNHSIYDRIGGGYRLGLEFRSSNQILEKHPNLSWMINVSSEAHIAGEYSQDLFGLMFFGNEKYAGTEASLSNSTGSFVDYLSIGGGIHNKKTKSFISLNVILPRSFYDGSIHRGTFTTSEQGDQLDLMLQGNLEISNSPAYFQGLGGAVNFDYNLPFGKAENNDFHGVFRISGRNLGAYKLHNVDRYEIDADQSFSGFTFDDLNEFFDGEKEPSTTIEDTLGIENSTSSPWKLIPGFIQAGKIVESNRSTQLQSFFGIRMYTNFLYRPLIYAGVDYKPFEKYSFGTQATFGGYGLFRLGLYANYSAEKINIGIGTEDLLGLAFEGQYGQSAVVRLMWNL
ncbi:MAG: hypothetical protein WED10_10035 [Brumimicrobium sp.]